MKHHLISSLVKTLRSRGGFLWRSFRRPEVQKLFIMSSFAFLLLVSAHTRVFAQAAATDGGAVTTTLQNLMNTVYFQWRIPISILGLFAAALAFFSSSPHGKYWALRIFIGVVLWALIPTFISLISSWTGTTGSGNINGGNGGI